MGWDIERSSNNMSLQCMHANNYTNLLLIFTLHSMMRYLIVSSFPSLTAIPSGVSPSLVTAPIVVSHADSVRNAQYIVSETITNERHQQLLPEHLYMSHTTQLYPQ